MTKAERKLLIKTAEGLAGALAVIENQNTPGIRRMVHELFIALNAVQEEEYRREVGERRTEPPAAGQTVVVPK